MEITKELLIDQLFDVQENQFQVGYNTAIIQLLKISQSGYIPKMSLRDAFYREMNERGFKHQSDYLRNEQVTQILQAVKDKQKLQAVKLLKEYAGLGLKEAKDTIDPLYAIENN